MAICASCRPGLGLRPVRPCAAGDALAGLSPASWGPGAEGCDLLAGRGLGGPAGVDLRKLSARLFDPAARAALCCRCCWLLDPPGLDPPGLALPVLF